MQRGLLYAVTFAAAKFAANVVYASAPLAAHSRTPPTFVEATEISGLPTDWRFVDVSGRERLFRGVNVVYKDPPWLPTATAFNTNFSFVADDAKLLSSLGFNLIRLGVMWPGVNPDSMSQVNHTYIAEIKKLIAIAAAEGIYTMIDPHQDEMNPRFCGEGAPNWWVVEHTSVGDFPVPVRSEHFPINASRLCPGLDPEACPGVDFPGRELCDLNSSFSYIWTHAGAKAYQTLWENAEAFAAFWKTVAAELHEEPGVIGGELWNEPFPGDVFGQPEMRDNKHADLVNLFPFYKNITTSIREAVPAQKKFAIAYEPTWPVGDQDLNPKSLLPSTSGFEKLPEENGVYAFHWYSPPADSNLSRYLDARVADSRRLKAAPYASEWNFGAGSSAKEAQDFAANVAQFESRRIAYTGWQYKNYQGALPGGTCTGCGSSFFNVEGTARAGTFAGMSTPFAQAVAGRAVSISITPLDTPEKDRRYTLTYQLTGTMAPTEIVIPSAWLLTANLKVGVGEADIVTLEEVSGAQLTKDIGYSAWTKVFVKHDKRSTAAAEYATVTISAHQVVV